MNLYHYTKFSNFGSIWIQQRIKFSEWTNCNDVFEREKIYNLTLQSKQYNGKECPPVKFKQFVSEVFKEAERYRQVSFSLDYKDLKGYASPMMWGHYARDSQRSGVCIELDSSKIKLEPERAKVFNGRVVYKKELTATHIGGVNAELEDAAQMFVERNRKQLFFHKHKHWQPENEYRFISKDCKFLDISDAITSVYVLGEDNVTLQLVKRIIMDTERISFLNVGGLKSLKLNPMNLYDYEDMIELMNNINNNNQWDTE